MTRGEPTWWPFFYMAAGVVVLAWIHHRIAAHRLQQWAQANGLHVLSREVRYQRTGPFHGRHRGGQLVYRVCVQTAEGVERQGWVRVGHWLLGATLSQEAVVIWDEDAGTSRSNW